MLSHLETKICNVLIHIVQSVPVSTSGSNVRAYRIPARIPGSANKNTANFYVELKLLNTAIRLKKTMFWF